MNCAGSSNALVLQLVKSFKSLSLAGVPLCRGTIGIASVGRRLSSSSFGGNPSRFAMARKDSGSLPMLQLRRGIKSTSTIHPEPMHKEDEKVLEKVLQEREDCEDLPESMMTNPYERPQRKCILCQHGIEPDWKNPRLLYQFVSPYTGEVYAKHITGLCNEKQLKLEKCISMANYFGWMSGRIKEPEFLKDPKLCDPERPIKPHKY